MKSHSEGSGHGNDPTAKAVLGRIDELEFAHEQGEIAIGPRDDYLEEREDIRRTLGTAYQPGIANNVARLIDQGAFDDAREQVYELITGEEV